MHTTAAQHHRANVTLRPWQKEEKAEGGLPEVEIILKGLLGEKGVEGFLVFNDAGAVFCCIFFNGGLPAPSLFPSPHTPRARLPPQASL